MVHTPQNIIDNTTLACISMAEHPNTPVEEARTAALKVFQRLRSKGISLPEILARKAPSTIVPDQPLTVLMTEKLQHLAEIKDLKTKVAGLRAKIAAQSEKIATLSQNVVVAKNESRELRGALKSTNAKVSDAVASARKASKAEMAAMKAELKSARAQAAKDKAELAAERAKPAPISADDLATLEDAARDQQSRIATLLDKLAKDVAAPSAAPAPAAPPGTSKRSQGAHKAWATRRAKAAAAARTAAPAPKARKAPRTGS